MFGLAPLYGFGLRGAAEPTFIVPLIKFVEYLRGVNDRLKRSMGEYLGGPLPTMSTNTLEMALLASGCDDSKIVHGPRLLSDNGSSYISSDLAE
jgi:hypothetical protein